MSRTEALKLLNLDTEAVAKLEQRINENRALPDDAETLNDINVMVSSLQHTGSPQQAFEAFVLNAHHHDAAAAA